VSELPQGYVQFFERYKAYLQFEKGYSALTIKTYLTNITALCLYLTELGIDDWALVQPNHLTQWLIHIRKANVKPRTLQLKLSSIKGLFKFLNAKGYINQNPAELLQSPKADKPLPKNMEVDQISSLLSFTPQETIEYRDKAMLELFYSSGIRLSELVNIDLTQLDIGAKELRVIGKGNKERIVPIGRQAIEAIEQWLQVRGEFNKYGLSALFVSKLGNQISTRQVQQRLAFWAQKQGVSENLHPHKLRHSFASHILESSSDLRAVQELLGHANLSTTQVYTHLDFQHLAKVYDQAHPRARKKKT
jgi:integrase/recombinase XerC